MVVIIAHPTSFFVSLQEQANQSVEIIRVANISSAGVTETTITADVQDWIIAYILEEKTNSSKNLLSAFVSERISLSYSDSVPFISF